MERDVTTSPESYGDVRLKLAHGTGAIPVVGFGTLIPDPGETRVATGFALDAGFRHLDCAERYRNEDAIGEAIQAALDGGTVTREQLFVTTKVWNTNHRPERVLPALEGSLRRLRVDYADLYLMHTPFAFHPGDEQDPRDTKGDIIYDDGVTLRDTWAAMERLVDDGRARAIGLSDIDLEKLSALYDGARIKPAVVQVEVHPYLPQTELLEFCNARGIVVLAFAPLGHGMRPGPLVDPVIVEIAEQLHRTPAQVLLGWAAQRGTAFLTTPRSEARAQENFDVRPLPDDAFARINRIETRQRYNLVVETGSPGFIPRGS